MDPLERKVEISPTKVYPGEKNKKITITFTAPGPMGSGKDPSTTAPILSRADAYETLAIGIPVDLRPDDDFADGTRGDLFNDAALRGDGTSGIRVAARGGAVLGTETRDVDR